MRTVLLWICAAIMALATSGQAGMGLRSMKITRQALQETPSLEVIVNRIQDIQQAQEFTRVFLFETPISADSKWAAALGQMTKAKADSIMNEMRKSGVYQDQDRVILSLAFYTRYAAAIKQITDTTGTYPNVIAAIGGVLGKDMTSLQNDYRTMTAKENELMELSGRKAKLQAQFRRDNDDMTKDSIREMDRQIEKAEKEYGQTQKTFVKNLKATLRNSPRKPLDSQIVPMVYNVLSFVYVMNRSMLETALSAAVQSARVIPHIPDEMKALGPRLLKESMQSALTGLKDMAGIESFTAEGLAKSLAGQLKFENGEFKLKIESIVELAMLDSTALRTFRTAALKPVTDLVNNVVEAPGRIARSADLVGFQTRVLTTLALDVVTNGADLGEELYQAEIQKIAKRAEEMNEQAQKLQKQYAAMPVQNLEMAFAHLSFGYNGFGRVNSDRFNGIYGFNENNEFSSPGSGFAMSVFGVQSAKTDFIRYGTAYQLSVVNGGTDELSVPGASMAGVDVNMNYVIAADPFFFFPHVIGNGAIEWFAGTGIGMNWGFGYAGLEPGDTSNHEFRNGAINEFRWTWNNAPTALGMVRLFNGALTVHGIYSYYLKEASLFNLNFVTADHADSSYHRPTFKNYKYEFDAGHFASNLFGAGNYFADTWYEGGQFINVGARLDLPFEVRPLSNFWIWMGENDPNRPEWSDLTIGSIGISTQYTASINNYSIKDGRNKLGVHVDNNEYSYVQHSVSILVDFLIGLDYKSAGAR